MTYSTKLYALTYITDDGTVHDDDGVVTAFTLDPTSRLLT